MLYMLTYVTTIIVHSFKSYCERYFILKKGVKNYHSEQLIEQCCSSSQHHTLVGFSPCIQTTSLVDGTYCCFIYQFRRLLEALIFSSVALNFYWLCRLFHILYQFDILKMSFLLPFERKIFLLRDSHCCLLRSCFFIGISLLLSSISLSACPRFLYLR